MKVFFSVFAVFVFALLGCGGASVEERSNKDITLSLSARDAFQLGIRAAGAGEYLRSEQYFVQAMRRGYPQDKVMPLLIQVCVGSSRLRAALQYAEPYLIEHPNAWPLRMLVASIYIGLEDISRARVELKKAITTAPKEPAPYYLLAVTEQKTGNENEAKTLLTHYLALAPNGTHAQEARSMLGEMEDGVPASGPTETQMP